MMRGSGRLAPTLIVLTVAPVVVGVAYAVGAAVGVLGAGADGFSLEGIANVLRSRDTWLSMIWTLAISLVATGAAFWAAVVSVETLYASPIGRKLTLLPFAIPHIAGALAILLLLGQSGLLSRLTFVFGLTTQPADFPALVYDQYGIGLMVSFFWKEFPFLALTALAVRSQLTPPLFEAALTLGASQQHIDRMIVRPIVAYGLLPAAISVFAFLVGQYEMASLLGPSSPSALSVLTYERITDPDVARRGEAYVLALVAMSLTLVLVWWYSRASRDLGRADT